MLTAEAAVGAIYLAIGIFMLLLLEFDARRAATSTPSNDAHSASMRPLGTPATAAGVPKCAQTLKSTLAASRPNCGISHDPGDAHTRLK